MQHKIQSHRDQKDEDWEKPVVGTWCQFFMIIIIIMCTNGGREGGGGGSGSPPPIISIAKMPGAHPPAVGC